MGIQQSNSKSIVSGLGSDTQDALVHFQKRFIVSAHPLDPTQSTLFLLHEKLSQKKFMLRIINTNDQEDSNKLQSLVCKKLANKPQGNELIGIDHYMIQHQKSYCNEIFHCYLLFKIQQKISLNQWFTYNKANQEVLDQNTIINGLNSLIQGVAWLKYYNHPHPNINLNSVLIEKDTKEFSLGDPWMMIGDIQTQYPSPQKLRKMNSQIDTFDPFLANIFSLGVVGLQILGFPELQKIYRRNYRIDNERLFNYIQSIKNQKLKILIAKLLGTPQQRQLLLKQRKNKNAKVKSLVPKQLSGKMSNIRKSFVSDHRSVMSPNSNTVISHPIHNFKPVFSKPNIENQLMNHQANRNYSNNAPPQQEEKKIGNFKPMNQNVIVPTDTNDKPMIQDDPLQNLRKVPKVNQMNQQPAFNNNRSNEVIRNGNNPQYYQPMPRNQQPVVYHNQNQPFTSTSINQQFSNPPQQKPYPYHPSEGSFIKGVNKTDYVFGKIPQGSPSPNILINSPPPLEKQPIKVSPTENKYSHGNTPTMMKEQINKPLGTNHSFRSSQSFIEDQTYKSQIQNELKQLQKKVSQAINNSHSLSEIENQKYSSSYVDSILINQKKSEYFQKNVYSTSNKPSENFQKQQKKQEEIKEQPKEVKKEDQIKVLEVEVDKKSDLQISNSPRNSQVYVQTEESLDYIDINTTPNLLSQASEKKVEEVINSESNKERSSEKQVQQKWESPIVPSTSVKNLQELANLTIPQQSDEQSLNGSQRRPVGEHVQETYENGGKYTGLMLNGKRNGQGIFHYKDGGYYDGNWKDNMMNGYGKLYYDNGKVAYEGQWYKDEFHGRGKVYNDSPQPTQESINYKDLSDTEYYWVFYEGDLVHDMKIGYGRMMFSNGQFYEGQYKNDVIHGKGQFHDMNGKTTKGLWQQGVLLKEL